MTLHYKNKIKQLLYRPGKSGLRLSGIKSTLEELDKSLESGFKKIAGDMGMKVKDKDEDV